MQHTKLDPREQMGSHIEKLSHAASCLELSRKRGRMVHVMLVRHCRSRQVVVTNEKRDGADAVRETGGLATITVGAPGAVRGLCGRAQQPAGRHHADTSPARHRGANPTIAVRATPKRVDLRAGAVAA